MQHAVQTKCNEQKTASQKRRPNKTNYKRNVTWSISFLSENKRDRANRSDSFASAEKNEQIAPSGPTTFRTLPATTQCRPLILDWPHQNRRATDHCTAIQWLVHWQLIRGLLHLVQRGWAWAGCSPAQSSFHCTNCNSPPISEQCTNCILFDVAL